MFNCSYGNQTLTFLTWLSLSLWPCMYSFRILLKHIHSVGWSTTTTTTAPSLPPYLQSHKFNRAFRKRIRYIARYLIHYLTQVALLGLLLYPTLYFRLHYRKAVQNILSEYYINLHPNSTYYHHWKGVPYEQHMTENNEPIKLLITFFDLLNTDLLLLSSPTHHPGKQLVARETNVFTFFQYPYRTVNGFDANNQTVFYYEGSVYYLDPATRSCQLDQPITVPNFPLIALLSQIERFNGVNNYMPFIPLFGGTLLDQYSVNTINHWLSQINETLFIRTTPRQLIFGYQMKFGQFIDDFIRNNTNNNNNVSKDGASGGGGGNRNASNFEKFKSWFKPNKKHAVIVDEGDENEPEKKSSKIGNFSLFNAINNTMNGPIELYTGLNGTKNVFSQYRSLNGMYRLSLWREERCNVINGSDVLAWSNIVGGGGHSHGGHDGGTMLKTYFPGACRSFDLQLIGTEEYKGIDVNRYNLSWTEFVSPIIYPPNSCYCTHRKQQTKNYCHWNGFIDLSPCYDGIPLYLSKPYFDTVDPEIGRKLIRYQRTVSKSTTVDTRIKSESQSMPTYDTHLLVQPMLGLTLYGSINLQLNIRLSNMSKFDLIQKSIHEHEYYIPFVHFAKQSHTPDRMAIRLWYFFLIVQSIYIGTIGCSVLVTVLFFRVFFHRYDDDDYHHFCDSSSSSGVSMDTFSFSSWQSSSSWSFHNIYANTVL